jgi:branched-chain amino acid transport system substrate-binding protein
VVPTTLREAKAQVQEMQALKVRTLYVKNDGSAYGQALALAVKNNAASAGLSVAGAPSGADAVFYGGSSQAGAARLFDASAAGTPAVKLFAPSALADPAFVSRLSSADRNVYVSAPGFLARDLPATAQTQFVKPFQDTYHRTPAPQAIFGYEAMSAVIAALHQAGTSASDRATVVRDFFALKNRSSVLGTYSINANGDTSLAPFVFSRLAGGKLVPFKSVQAQG